MASDTNPLFLESLPLPFDSVLPEHVVPAVRSLLADAEKRVEALALADGARTYANTMEPFDTLTEALDRAMGIVGHLEAVTGTPALRDAYREVMPEVSAFQASLTVHAGLWSAVRAFADTDEAKALDGEKKRFLATTIANFRREGADLPPDGKKRLAEIDVALSRETLAYAQAVTDASDAIEIYVEDEARVAGLPAGAMQAARDAATSRGKTGFRFSLQAPSFLPVMAHVHDRALREALYRANITRATSGKNDNRARVKTILALRRERAKLLGFATFADLVLDDRMAKNGKAARAFLDDLRTKTRPFFEREMAELETFYRKRMGADAPALAPWDVSYWVEQLRKESHDFDEEELRPYFAFDRVLAGVFEVARRLYGVTIEAAPDVPVWGKTVRAFRITDDKGQLLSTYYLDAFPREGKRDGAWMDAIVTRPKKSERVEVIVGNMTPPLGDAPALLSFVEVQTMFHEHGHLLHHALSEVATRGLAGTNVAWDFVELPSQIFENWCWEKEALDLFAGHIDGGAKIPDALFAKMRGARSFRAASAMMRQISMAEMDLALHIDFDPAGTEDPVAMGRAIIQAHSAVPLPDDYALVASFSHLFASPVGYAAGYYSYKWAEVMAADAFARFLAEGILDGGVGSQFRGSILARGNSAAPDELYRQFMGRDPKLDALLHQAGLTATASRASS
ncbi:MAG: prlC [Myxococcaceae bacterium]|nr:prlC [Myxococcaceae bacterium]